ncbi:MAG: DUF4410 domain-containing protein [Verrucomicrobiota bacterium]|nr:DUF4410 domain-containing protein [Verrucomicrobiota bacterium]
MKSLIVLLSGFLLCSCADMFVTNSTVGGSSSASTVASDPKDFGGMNGVHMVTNCGIGAYGPRAIYIRPFCIDTAIFRGDEAASEGEMPIRKALTPIQFAGRLKEQMEKMAPTRVLRDGESPRVGWLVDGEFTLVDGGSPLGRFFLGHFGVGRSVLAMHVRVTDVERGAVVYEFDVAGGSRMQGKLGTVRASGLGKATPFDLQNAAERIYLALSPDAFRYGARSDVSLR